VPLYALYALLFADTGLTGAEISALFAIWTAVAVVAEVPAGALADRVSRRAALVAAGALQAAGYAVWTALPGFGAFAAGFVLWGLGGALASGALEALLYDGLAAVGAEEVYARVLGWVTAAGLVAQLPAAAAATGLFLLGGHPLVGWVSVAICVGSAGLAARLPEAPRGAGESGGDEPGYLAILREGLREAGTRPAVRTGLLAVAALTGVDAVEEYFPLLARDWGVPTALNPLAVLLIPLAGAVGAALGGRAAGLAPRTLALLLGAAGTLLGAAGALGHAAGLGLVGAYYGLYHLVLVVVSTRLQERIGSARRATVLSVAGLGAELGALGLIALWALGEVALVAAAVLLLAATLPRLLR